MTEIQTEFVQVRDSEGGLFYFSTLREAMQYANDPTYDIWKVSFEIQSGERVRLTRTEFGGIREWVYDPLDVTRMLEEIENG